MKKNNIGFTLLELLIVISIVGLLMVSIYAPYSYYTNKSKVKLSKKQIAKTIYEARNMSIYGLTDGNINNSIGIYFDNSDIFRNKIRVYSYPYNYSGLKNDFTNTNIKLIKEIHLEPGVGIDKINNQDKAIFYFNAITGSGSYYYYNPSETSFVDKEINVKLSYKKDGGNLSSNVIFYGLTNIVDY